MGEQEMLLISQKVTLPVRQEADQHIAQKYKQDPEVRVSMKTMT
jgi:hypothetical protein